jgi:N-carbamoyl-L-amino-acid hydrolase
MDFTGRADHAGTTRRRDRNDPMLPFAHTILAARAMAAEHGARATVAKARVTPNGTNAIPSLVNAWLDARAADEAALEAVVAGVRGAAERAARDHGVEVAVTAESRTPLVAFTEGLRDRLGAVLAEGGPAVPVLPTGAGHDAGVLAAHVPTAMLYVRNPTGVSHSPHEWARPDDCHTGVLALADVLSDLLTGEAVR